jgi:hypothetical protein
MADENKIKGSDAFKEAIIAHLKDQARKDKLFIKTLKKEDKNIDDCLQYIFSHVKASGICGYTEAEIYQLARHYYDEDDIDIGEPVTQGEVISNQQMKLTDEEIAEGRAKAMEQVISDEMSRLKKKPAKKVVQASEKKDDDSAELSLF